MKLLVATSRYLLEVDVSSEETKVINKGYGLYYGITWDASFIYVAVRWYPRFMPTSHIERPRLLVFSPKWSLVEVLEYPVPAGGLHQIVYDDKKLYCSCSRDDSYIIRENNEWRIWYPSSDSNDHKKDTHHFNSIWMEQDKLFIIGHNNGPSDVWEFSRDMNKVIKKYRVGELIHNVWRERESLAVSNSGGGRVETTDGKILCETGGFPRGVVISPKVNFIGISSLANRTNRIHTKGSIQVYSKDWKRIKEIDIGFCGQVNEIRCLDDEDAAHNGLPLPV